MTDPLARRIADGHWSQQVLPVALAPPSLPFGRALDPEPEPVDLAEPDVDRPPLFDV